MRRLVRPAAALLLLALARDAPAWNSEPPADFGRVVLSNFTAKAGMAPAQFDHWRHRARHTCRVCHVDVGFAMAIRETKVSASTNQSGFHCGACHNGQVSHAGKPIFAACESSPKKAEEARCKRCHAMGDPAQRRKDFEAFAADLPRKGRSGEVDWEEAEARGRIRLLDYIEGVSIPRTAIKMDKDVTIASQGWMTDVRFSHKKHAVWNGCEVCHPEIFPNGPGAGRRSMQQISAGESCGACHGKVAFSLGDCRRCHVKAVE